MMKLVFTALAAVLLGGLPTLARAAVVTYNDPSSYAATTGNTAYTFPAASSGGQTNENGTYTLGPLTFTSATVYLYSDGYYGTDVNYLSVNNSAATISLSGATALSFTLSTFYGPQNVAISINGDPAITLTTASGPPNTVFVGFTDTVPITSLTFTNTTVAGDKIDTINFQVGTAAVPEPGTCATGIVGAGLLGLATLRRRRMVAR